MNIKSVGSVAAAFILVLLLPNASQAAVVTALPGGTPLALPNNGSSVNFTSGPISFGTGVTWSSNSAISVFGYTGTYGFSDTSWSGVPMAGLNTSTGSMSFSFSAPISGFLGQIDWANDGEVVSMSAFNSANQLIETITFTNAAGNNLVASDGFYGFQDATADISRIQLTDGLIGIRDIDITTAVTAVPESSTWAMMILGFCGLGFMGYRRKQNGSALSVA
jgi:hypothetical protein